MQNDREISLNFVRLAIIYTCRRDRIFIVCSMVFCLCGVGRMRIFTVAGAILCIYVAHRLSFALCVRVLVRIERARALMSIYVNLSRTKNASSLHAVIVKYIYYVFAFCIATFSSLMAYSSHFSHLKQTHTMYGYSTPETHTLSHIHIRI